MAIDLEALVAQARQLPRPEWARLIARLSEELAQDTDEPGAQPSTLEELLRVAKPWQGPSRPVAQEEDQEVTEFIEWRRKQREQDRELEAKRDARPSEIWGD